MRFNFLATFAILCFAGLTLNTEAETYQVSYAPTTGASYTFDLNTANETIGISSGYQTEAVGFVNVVATQTNGASSTAPVTLQSVAFYNPGYVGRSEDFGIDPPPHCITGTQALSCTTQMEMALIC